MHTGVDTRYTDGRDGVTMCIWEKITLEEYASFTRTTCGYIASPARLGRGIWVSVSVAVVSGATKDMLLPGLCGSRIIRTATENGCLGGGCMGRLWADAGKGLFCVSTELTRWIRHSRGSVRTA